MAFILFASGGWASASTGQTDVANVDGPPPAPAGGETAWRGTPTALDEARSGAESFVLHRKDETIRRKDGPGGDPSLSPTAADKVPSSALPNRIMSRLGQGNLRFRNYGVGTVWVSRVEADVALQPRIALSAGCQVQDILPNEEFPEGVVGFTIAALGGQLRWQTEPAPWSATCPSRRDSQHFRSTNHAYEHAFTMCCDVPHNALSRLEAERGGAPRSFGWIWWARG